MAEPRWLLLALVRVENRLEKAGAARCLKVMQGMSDDELRILGTLEAEEQRRDVAPPSLEALIKRGRAA